jgi:hypothetical protein
LAALVPASAALRLAAWRDWKGGWLADVSRPGFRRELARRIAPRLVRKGFDGLFLDNVDMIEQRRHRAQRAGMRKLCGGAGRDRLDGGGGKDRCKGGAGRDRVRRC